MSRYLLLCIKKETRFLSPIPNSFSQLHFLEEFPNLISWLPNFLGRKKVRKFLKIGKGPRKGISFLLKFPKIFYFFFRFQNENFFEKRKK